MAGAPATYGETDAPRPTGLAKWLLVAFATLATMAYDFTWTVVSVALPHMQGTFSTTSDQIAWVLIGFMVGSAFMTACTGWLSARFGRKNLFLFSIAGYTITLVGCAMSGTLIEATAWRFVQGVTGASLLPLGQTIVVDAFPKDRHGQATSIWGIGVMVGNVSGPIGGGFILEHMTWPWVFYVTVPVGIIAFFGVLFFVPASEPDRTRRFDWFGFFTLVLGVGLLQLMLARAEREDWFASPEIVIEAVAAGILLYLFTIHTIFAKNPFVDRSLFTDRNFITGIAMVTVMGAIIVLPSFLLPVMLQQVGGFPPVETGKILIWRGSGVLLGLILLQRVAHRLEPRGMIVTGLILQAVPALYMAQWTPELQRFEVSWTNFVQGFGGSLIWVPISTLTLAGVAKRVQDQAYALFFLVFEIGSSVGVAAIAGQHVRDIQINHAALTEHIHPFNEVLRAGEAMSFWTTESAAGLAALEAEINRQSTMIAYNNAFFATAIMAFVLVPVVLLFRRVRKEPDEPAPAAPTEAVPAGADR